MRFRTRSLSVAATAVVALVALTGIEQSASAKPARELGWTANAPVTGNELGGVLTVTPISEQEYDDFLVPGDQCVTDMGMTLCQQALFDKGYDDRYEEVAWTAVAAVGPSTAVYAEADATLNDGTVLDSTGGATSTSPWVRISWVSPPPPPDPGSDGPGIGIPADASGMTFQMDLTVPGVGALTGYCPSDPEHDQQYRLHCSLHPPVGR